MIILRILTIVIAILAILYLIGAMFESAFTPYYMQNITNRIKRGYDTIKDFLYLAIVIVLIIGIVWGFDGVIEYVKTL